MSGSLIGALRVTLGIDTAAFEQGLGVAQKRLGAAGKSMQAFGDRLTGIGANLSIGLTAPLVAFGTTAVTAANESAAALAQVEAALDSMGPVAGKTSEQLQKAAEDLQHLSTFDDDDILKSVTANMLTFGNITGDVFDRAQQAALNLSARLGQDLQSSTIQVGKALNDPIKGIKALSRVGVSFTDQQKAQIEAMVGVGDVAGAQAIILGELDKQYGGAAKAARDATPTAATVDAWRNFQETVGAIVADVLPPLTNILTGVLEAFNNLDPSTQTFIVGLAAAAAAIGPVLVVAGSLTSAIGGLLPVFGPVSALIGEVGLAGALGAAATAAAPFIAAAAALAAGWALFGDKIGPVLEALKTKFQEVLGQKLQSLFNTVKTTLTELWNGPFGEAIRVVIGVLGDFGAAYTSILGEVLLRIISALVTAVENGFKIIGDVFRIIGALLSGDFSAAWNGVKTLVSDVVNGWIAVLNSLAPEAVAAVRALVAGVQEWAGNKLTAIWLYAKEQIQSLGDKFKWLWDVVVGHSYIPDLFDGIKKHAGRFFPEFVKPVTDGIDEVAAGFAGLSNMDPASIVTAFADDNPLEGGILNATEETSEATDEFGDRVKKTTEQVVKNFADMADGVVRSLANLKDTISNGDFFDVVLSVLDVVSSVLGTIGQINGLGGNADASVNISGRASGGPVIANTPYIVGERRAELFVPSTSGRIEPNLNSSGRGGGVVNNYYGPGAAEFWGKINKGHEDAARKGAAGGAQIAMQQLQRGRQRALA
ncbi:MAG: phage tail length tape measure family protein [Sphingomonas sp.]|jgi:phage-related protein